MNEMLSTKGSVDKSQYKLLEEVDNLLKKVLLSTGKCPVKNYPQLRTCCRESSEHPKKEITPAKEGVKKVMNNMNIPNNNIITYFTSL